MSEPPALLSYVSNITLNSTLKSLVIEIPKSVIDDDRFRIYIFMYSCGGVYMLTLSSVLNVLD